MFVSETDPFLRKSYRALEFGTVVIDGKIVGFDVLDEADSEKFLIAEEKIRRIDGKIAISHAVPDRPNSVQQQDDTLVSLRIIDEVPKTPLKTDVIREFLQVESEPVQETYTGPCI